MKAKFQSQGSHLLSALLSLAAAALAPAALSAAVTVHGKVIDGTTNRPVANQTVLLLTPREGMQAVAKASTDAQGVYAIKSDEAAAGFYLVEVNYQEAKYHAPVKPSPDGTASADVTVYDATSSPAALRIKLLRMMCRAEGAKANVRKEYTIVNSSNPPRAYVSPNGAFHFHVPQGAGQPKAAVTGLMGMQLPEAPENGKQPGDFLIRIPIKPGENVITVDYEADYRSMQLDLGDKMPFPVAAAELYVTPSSLAVDSSALKPAGVDQQDSIEKFDAQNLAVGAVLDARLSGEAISTPRAPGSEPSGEQGEGNIKALPNSVTKVGWPLLACFLLITLWALGVRVTKDWPAWKDRTGDSPTQKQRTAKVDKLIDSLVDLDELFEAGKILEKEYWRERLELKARIVAQLKKGPPATPETYATRSSSGPART
ncbi:MAG TPA: carboxypeptidase-like regulatory domain-containing protein [Terriglobia bacterium]|nr:carboxypeptidase-like regulatory domain-containing protein [Terriglobia bacterium]